MSTCVLFKSIIPKIQKSMPPKPYVLILIKISIPTKEICLRLKEIVNEKPSVQKENRKVSTTDSEGFKRLWRWPPISAVSRAELDVIAF